MSLTTIDLDAFDPVPLPTIALAASMVSYQTVILVHKLMSHRFRQLYNCLEEYATGEHIVIEYSEDEYQSHYLELLDNLKKFEASASRGKLLDDLQDMLFKAGM